MISATQYHIQARDFSSIAHIKRSRELITYYLEGVSGPEAILEAGWHLACGVVKHEEIRPQGREATGSRIAGSDSKDAANSGMDSN